MYVLQNSFLYRSIFYLTDTVTSATICVMVGSQVIAFIPVWYESGIHALWVSLVQLILGFKLFYLLESYSWRYYT